MSSTLDRMTLDHPHRPGRRQLWDDLDDDIHRFVLDVTATTRAVLEPTGFVGSYLHGSLALGSYYRPKSDIDLVFVVEQPLSPDLRLEVWRELAALSDRRPTLGDIEVTVLLRSTAERPASPCHYEVHYSERMRSMAEAEDPHGLSLGGEDPDLAAQLAVVSSSGITVSGEPIGEVFAPIPVELYRAAVEEDINWILDGSHLLESPYYGMLNLCRWLMQGAAGWGGPISKDDAGMWALEHTPPHLHQIIAQALACYRSGEDVAPEQRRTDGHSWNASQLLEFRDHVKTLR